MTKEKKIMVNFFMSKESLDELKLLSKEVYHMGHTTMIREIIDQWLIEHKAKDNELYERMEKLRGKIDQFLEEHKDDAE